MVVKSTTANPTERQTTMKKQTRAKPKISVKDLKAKTNPKGGGVIVHEKGTGSVNPNGWSNHNETFVSDATD
jgi:hypothetical protein